MTSPSTEFADETSPVSVFAAATSPVSMPADMGSGIAEATTVPWEGMTSGFLRWRGLRGTRRGFRGFAWRRGLRGGLAFTTTLAVGVVSFMIDGWAVFGSARVATLGASVEPGLIERTRISRSKQAVAVAGTRIPGRVGIQIRLGRAASVRWSSRNVARQAGQLTM